MVAQEQITTADNKRLCQCGCNELIDRFDKYGIERFYKYGHNWLGKKHSEKTRLKMRLAKLAHRRQISEAMKGRKLSDETRKKMSLAKIGEKNPRYNGKQKDKGHADH